MNFKEIPIKSPGVSFFMSLVARNPSTLSSHFGPGSQWGKPFYPMGQECEKVNVPRSSKVLSLSATAQWQCLPNSRLERTVRKLHDPPSARSCIVSHNPDGLFMDSQSHYTKAGWLQKASNRMTEVNFGLFKSLKRA